MDRFEFYHKSVDERSNMELARWGDLPGISFLSLQITFRRAERKGVETAYLLDLWGVQSD